MKKTLSIVSILLFALNLNASPSALSSPATPGQLKDMQKLALALYRTHYANKLAFPGVFGGDKPQYVDQALRKMAHQMKPCKTQYNNTGSGSSGGPILHEVKGEVCPLEYSLRGKVLPMTQGEVTEYILRYRVNEPHYSTLNDIQSYLVAGNSEKKEYGDRHEGYSEHHGSIQSKKHGLVKISMRTTYEGRIELPNIADVIEEKVSFIYPTHTMRGRKTYNYFGNNGEEFHYYINDREVSRVDYHRTFNGFERDTHW